MKIAIQVLYTSSWQGIVDITKKNLSEYCEKHGYHLFLIEYPEPPKSDMGYDKLKRAKKLFEADYDIVWCLDADANITSHKYRVEEFVNDTDYLFISKDVNSINAGSFILKKSEWTNTFIDYCLGKRGQEKMYCEQNAIEAYMQEFGTDKIRILNHPSINSYKYQYYKEHNISEPGQGQWVNGCFVLHLPGIGIDKRIEELKNTPIEK